MSTVPSEAAPLAVIQGGPNPRLRLYPNLCCPTSYNSVPPKHSAVNGPPSFSYLQFAGTGIFEDVTYVRHSSNHEMIVAKLNSAGHPYPFHHLSNEVVL